MPHIWLSLQHSDIVLYLILASLGTLAGGCRAHKALVACG